MCRACNESLEADDQTQAGVKRTLCPGIMVFSSLLRVLFINRQARRLLSLINEVEMGVRADDVFPPAVAELCREAQKALLSRTAGNPGVPFVVRCRCVAGDTAVAIQGIGVPNGSDGRRAHIVVTMRQVDSWDEPDSAQASLQSTTCSQEESEVVFSSGS